MFILYFEIAMLVLAVFAVLACVAVLAYEDPAANQLHEWIRMYIVRIRHAPRHTPQHIERKRTECKLSYVLHAT